MQMDIKQKLLHNIEVIEIVTLIEASKLFVLKVQENIVYFKAEIKNLVLVKEIN